MFGEKALKLAHLLLHAQREVNMIAEVAQTASDGLVALDSEKVDKADIDTIIHSLHAAIFSGEVPAALYSSSGTEMTTDGGMEIYAIKKFKAEGGGA